VEDRGVVMGDGVPCYGALEIVGLLKEEEYSKPTSAKDIHWNSPFLQPPTDH